MTTEGTTDEPRTATRRLPTPGAEVAEDVASAQAWVSEHLGHLVLEGPDGVRASPAFRGGQQAADVALAGLDVTGYARARSEVLPVGRRGASRMSPYIRYGLLDLPTVWDRVVDAPSRDRAKYRDELLWQEYARHVYARVGTGMASALRREPARGAGWEEEPWPSRMACMSAVVDELHTDGWLVNQTRMWLASQWTVRAGAEWTQGEDEFFRHLLDGSRAANRLGWQWTVGAGTGKAYGFSRWQVEKRAPGLCRSCPLRDACPVQEWPDADAGGRVAVEPEGLRTGAAPAGGPSAPEPAGAEPDAVWLTFESLGDADPALAAHPDLPVHAVFDEPLLARLRLSGKRLVFLAETLADLATRRELVVHLGRAPEALADLRVAVTHAPVPGFARLSRQVAPALVHPWPWLARPTSGPAQSFSAWRRGLRL